MFKMTRPSSVAFFDLVVWPWPQWPWTCETHVSESVKRAIAIAELAKHERMPGTSLLPCFYFCLCILNASVLIFDFHIFFIYLYMCTLSLKATLTAVEVCCNAVHLTDCWPWYKYNIYLVYISKYTTQWRNLAWRWTQALPVFFFISDTARITHK